MEVFTYIKTNQQSDNKISEVTYYKSFESKYINILYPYYIPGINFLSDNKVIYDLATSIRLLDLITEEDIELFNTENKSFIKSIKINPLGDILVLTTFNLYLISLNNEVIPLKNFDDFHKNKFKKLYDIIFLKERNDLFATLSSNIDDNYNIVNIWDFKGKNIESIPTNENKSRYLSDKLFLS